VPFSALIVFVLFAGFAALTQKGVEPTLELVRKIVNIAITQDYLLSTIVSIN
jgi:hypothetical protein